jgi:hypothetical protein
MSGIYNRAKAKMGFRGEIIPHAQTMKVMLVSTGYSYDPDHDVVSQASPHEVTGTGYVGGFGGAGRKVLTNKTSAEDDAGNRGYFDADDVTWAGINVGTVGAAIVYREVTSDADSDLVAYVDGGGFPAATNGGALTLQWSNTPLGILQAV